MASLPPWSYTMLSAIETCPRQAYHRYILKEKEPETEAMRHGTEAHTALENYLKGQPLPFGYSNFEPLARQIRDAVQPGWKLFAEYKMGVDAQLQAHDFFSPTVWGRGVADILLVGGTKAWVGDWKTGKRKENSFQVSIFALFVFAHFSEVEKVTANNIWLKENAVGQTYVYHREDAAAIWVQVARRVEAANAMAATDQPWPANPGGLCKNWCAIKSCAHCGRK